MANFTLQEKVLQWRSVFFFCVSEYASNYIKFMKKVSFQMYNTSQSLSWSIYVLHMARLSTQGSVLDLIQVLDTKKHTALWKSQGLNLSYLFISARKPIFSGPSSDWLIYLRLGSTGLAGTQTSVPVMVSWHGTPVPCIRNQRDGFHPSPFSAGTSCKWQLVPAHCVAWTHWNYVWILSATPYFLKKPHKDLPMRTSVDLHWLCSQWTYSWFWIFCFINSPGS